MWKQEQKRVAVVPETRTACLFARCRCGAPAATTAAVLLCIRNTMIKN